MADKRNQKIPLSRERWMELAIEALQDKGKSKFSLDALIRAMPVSKGSFYWHFTNREEFLNALVEYWDRHETQEVIDAMAALPRSATAQDRLWELMCVVHEKKHSRYDHLIRSLTREFPVIREAVTRVDKKRYAIVRAQFEEMDFKGDELEMRTRAFVATTSMESQLLLELPETEFRRQLKLRHAFFTRP